MGIGKPYTGHRPSQSYSTDASPNKFGVKWIPLHAHDPDMSFSAADSQYHWGSQLQSEPSHHLKKSSLFSEAYAHELKPQHSKSSVHSAYSAQSSGKNFHKTGYNIGNIRQYSGCIDQTSLLHTAIHNQALHQFFIQAFS